VIEDPVLRQRLSFQQVRDDSGREVLEVDVGVDPGGGVTPHVHPLMEERFTVVEGECSFLSGRRWETARAGETVVVPAGTRHAYRNRSGAPARLLCRATPPQTLQEFLEQATAFGREGLTTRHALPKSPRALLKAALLIERHREMVTLGFPPLPPGPLQRVLFPPLARLARRLGYSLERAGQT
jgi:quercetin dioxygenase-like cupin family protein